MFSSLFLSECSIVCACGPSVSAVDILDPSIVSPCLNCRQGNDLENIKKNMISMYLLVLIRMTRQHEKNVIYLNKHVFTSWQINEREDIVQLTCVFKHWTRYELQFISNLLQTTNVLIPEKSKEIKQRKESGNLATRSNYRYKSWQVSLWPQYSVHVDSNRNSLNKLIQVCNYASAKAKTEIENSLECG